MTTTTLRRPTRTLRIHVPYEHPDVPGVCYTCHLPILDGRYTNERHVTLDELLSHTSGQDVMELAAGERYG